MKKYIFLSPVAGIMVILIVFFGCITCNASDKKQNAPTVQVVVNPSIVSLDKAGKLAFMGSGFNAGEEVRLLFKTSDGVTADIGYALDSPPVANSQGAWVTVWSFGRFVKKGLVSEGAYAILVADKDYNILTSAPFCFLDSEKSVEERPEWSKIER